MRVYLHSTNKFYTIVIQQSHISGVTLEPVTHLKKESVYKFYDCAALEFWEEKLVYVNHCEKEVSITIFIVFYPGGMMFLLCTLAASEPNIDGHPPTRTLTELQNR